LVQLVLSVSARAGVGRQIAAISSHHFNLIGVAVVILFLPAIARLLEKINSRCGDRQLQRNNKAGKVD